MTASYAPTIYQGPTVWEALLLGFAGGFAALIFFAICWAIWNWYVDWRDQHRLDPIEDADSGDGAGPPGWTPDAPEDLADWLAQHHTTEDQAAAQVRESNWPIWLPRRSKRGVHVVMNAELPDGYIPPSASLTPPPAIEAVIPVSDGEAP